MKNESLKTLDHPLFAECNNYLGRVASEVQVVEPTAVQLYSDIHDIPMELWRAFNDAVNTSGDLDKVGLYPRIFWGITNLAPDLEPEETASIRLRAEASVLIDKFQLKENSNTYYILFTHTLIQEVFYIFDSMLSLPEVLPYLGSVHLEKPRDAIVARPTDVVRRSFAIDLAIMALEFAFLHELYHVVCGHLDKLYVDYNELAMYAVGTQDCINEHQANNHKVFEIDADLMALSHMMMNFHSNKRVINLGNQPLENNEESIGQQFEKLGFSLTVFFRLIELWRRDVRLIYNNNADHPHPDVRDGCLMAHARRNADTKSDEAQHLANLYEQGRENAIESIVKMDGTIPTFGVTTDLGQDTAVNEIESLLSQLNSIRSQGVGPMDFRVRNRSLLRD